MPLHSNADPQTRVVLTRPAGLNGGLHRQLLATRPSLLIEECPLLHFSASERAADIAQTLAGCRAGDWLIFVSPRAVVFTASLIAFAQLPAVQFACIGQATADALQAACPDATPRVPISTADSEGLLAAIDPAEIAGRQVWLLRGQDGREQLAEQLRAWGATVTPLPVYQRHCAPPQHWPSAPALWVLTAPAALRCLHGGIMQNAEPERARLLHSPLVLINPRAASLAQQLGFTGEITVSHAPDDLALAAACQHALSRYLTNQESAP